MKGVGLTWQRARIRRDFDRLVGQRTPIDFGVELRVVTRPRANAEVIYVNGSPVSEVNPPRRYNFGGMMDPTAREIVAPSENPLVWYCSEAQAVTILHRFESREPPTRMLTLGSTGGGKTSADVRWALLCCIVFGRNGSFGVFAPTGPRLNVLWDEMLKLPRTSWVLDVRRADHEIILANGCKISFIAAKAQSDAIGTPAQGFTFTAGAIIDEEQDIEAKNLSQILLRCRNPHGAAWIHSTATRKRNIEWMERRRRYEEGGLVRTHNLTIKQSPFVSPEFVEQMRRELSPDDYAMLVEAVDAPSSRAVYPKYCLRESVRLIPEIGVEDITEQITDGARLLIGHDPGEIFDVSILLRAFRDGQHNVLWWVVGEVTTKRTTAEEHADALAEAVKRMRIKPQHCLIRKDPNPDRATETALRSAGFSVRPALSKVTPSGVRPLMIAREQRIATVNKLLCNARGLRRLFILRNRYGNPVAEKLSNALVISERDPYGRSETDKKIESDQTHWPCALGYALYRYERPKLDLIKDKKKWA